MITQASTTSLAGTPIDGSVLGMDIGNLPSNFWPYDYKNLLIRPMTVKELRLLSKASVLGTMDPVITAVGRCINRDVNMLTIGDFYYVLAWLKLYSTPKSPWTIEWHCEESFLKHKERDEFIYNDQPWPLDLDMSQYDIIPCKCHNSSQAQSSMLDIIQLPEDNPIVLEPGFDWPRVKNMVEIRNALRDPELNMIVGAAQWVVGGGQDTLDDKIKRLEEESTLDMFDQGQAYNDTLVHGIEETCTVLCRKCLKRSKYPIKLDPVNFFR